MEKFRTKAIAKGSVAILGASCMLLAGCTGQGSSETKKQPPAAHTIGLIPNMSGYLKPGSTTTCYNGGPRPCAILIRTAPELSADFINANPNQYRVDWPLESYGSNPGDKVQVACYDPNGQDVHPFEGNGSSKDWYKLLVPEEHVLNPGAKGIDRIGSEAVGWASVEWFGENSPNPSVPSC